MKPKIEISVDKTKVTEGDVVEVRWSCSPAEQVQFTLDNGYKANSIDVEPSGCKKFRLNRSRGRTQLVIGVTNGGKTYYKSVAVRVKKLKSSKDEHVYDYTGVGGMRQNGLKTTWQNLKSKFNMFWNYMPEKKKMAYKILLLLCVFSLLSLIWPKLMSIGLYFLFGYLVYVIVKR